MTPLRQRMQHDMQIRNLADNTQQSYLLQVSSFARHFRRSPEALGPEEIRAWLIHLREERKLAPSSLSPAIGALRFLYRVTLKRPWSDEDALIRWYQEGADVQSNLPKLAIYMGHVSIVSTAYYLPFVPTIAALASERFEKHLGHVLGGRRP